MQSGAKEGGVGTGPCDELVGERGTERVCGESSVEATFDGVQEREHLFFAYEDGDVYCGVG